MVLIFSWNVAGLSTTVNRIQTNYSSSSTSSSSLSNHNSRKRQRFSKTTTTTTSDYDHDENDDNNNDTTTSSRPQQEQEQNERYVPPKSLIRRPSLLLSSSSSSFFLGHYFMNLHQADILCFQEHKTSQKTLTNRLEPYQCSTFQCQPKIQIQQVQQLRKKQQQDEHQQQSKNNTDNDNDFDGDDDDNSTRNDLRNENKNGMNETNLNSTSSDVEEKNEGIETTIESSTTTITYESYWSCCTDPRSKGFNGVVTYARSGTVLYANGDRVFQCTELDIQGRCIVTIHHTFIVFNVYVPASCGQTTCQRMKFLHHLRKAMQQHRKQYQKPIILVGDLNIAHTLHDVHWEDRVIYIDDIIKEVNQYHPNKQQQLPFHGTTDEEQEHDDIMEMTQQSYIPEWKINIATYWDYIESVLQTKHVVPTQTTNSKTKEKYNKYRLAVYVQPTVTTPTPPTQSGSSSVWEESKNITNNKTEPMDKNIDNQTTTTTTIPLQGASRRIFLGNHELDQDYCLSQYDYSCKMYYDSEQDQHIVAREKNTVPIYQLIELMQKLIPITTIATTWSNPTFQRRIEGMVDRVSPPRKWLSTMLQEDHMIDTFRYYYPTATARFTCWNQNKNQRYCNHGARIDYTIMDATLLPYLRKGTRIDETITTRRTPITTTTNDDTENATSFLRCGCNQHVLDEEMTGHSLTSNEPIKNQDKNHSNHNQNNHHRSTPLSAWCEEAALCAATSNGRYQPAAYEGGGIMEATQETLDTQFGTPHTGHIYTPPTFSDHIAVSLLLHDSILTTNNRNDVDVKEDKNVLSEKSIVDILTKTGTSTTRRAQPHKMQTTIASFFAPSSQNVTNKMNGQRTKQQTIITKPTNNKPKKNSILYHFQKSNKK